MDSDINVDFSDQIKSNALNELGYQGPRLFKEKDYQEFKYLNIDIKKLLDFPPPLNHSKQTLNELAEVKEITEREHPESYTSKLEEMDKDPSGFIYKYYKELTGKELPKKFVKIIESKDVDTLAIKLKVFYNRPRPYEIALKNKVYLKYNKKIQKKALLEVRLTQVATQ